jgi:predicted RNase H-like HicB family nuclease
MNYAIEFEQEVDGRWIAEIPSLPGVMVYGATKEQSELRVKALAVASPALAEIWNNPEDDVYDAL